MRINFVLFKVEERDQDPSGRKPSEHHQAGRNNRLRGRPLHRDGVCGGRTSHQLDGGAGEA